MKRRSFFRRMAVAPAAVPVIQKVFSQPAEENVLYETRAEVPVYDSIRLDGITRMQQSSTIYSNAVFYKGD